MCTATLLPLPDGFRLAFNRDESRNRPAALPPQIRTFGTHSAIMPIDPISDGTWIAVNDAGLVMALLNRNPTPAPGAAFDASRGTIIPSLLDCDNLTSAKSRACDLATHRFAPFRLLLADRGAVVALAYREQELSVAETSITRPLLFTSSGLGDDFVRAPRQQLFEKMIHANVDLIAQQDAFHRHSWPDRQHVSVCMRRDRARTVSFTLVELGQADARLTYWPQPPDEPGPSFTLSLSLHASASDRHG